MLKRYMLSVFFILSMLDVAYAENYAISFDGTDDYVEIADDPSLDFENTDSYTIEAWIKPAALLTSGHGIVSKYQTGNVNGYMLRIYEDDIEFDEMRVSDVLTLNQWQHIAAVNNGGTRTLYLNGVEKTLSGTALSVQVNGDPINIGRDFSSRYFNGEIDEVRIWNTARTATEIADNMNNGLDGTESGLVAYYTMDEGSGTTLTDKTNNNNDGTINGGATWEPPSTYDVTITLADSTNGFWSGIDPKVWTPNATGSNVAVSDILTELDAGRSVIITTGNSGIPEQGTLTVSSAIVKTSTANDATLTLEAGYRIIVDAAISSTSDKLHFVATAGKAAIPLNNQRIGQFRLNSAGSITTKGGNVTIEGVNNSCGNYDNPNNSKNYSCSTTTCRGIQLDGSIDAGGGNISLTGLRQGYTSAWTRGVQINNSVSTTGTGVITINGASEGDSDGVYIGATGSIESGEGNIEITGDAGTPRAGIKADAGSRIQTTGSGSVILVSTNGAINGSNLIFDSGGTTSLTAPSDDDILLDNVNNDFTGAVTVISGNNSTFKDANSLSLGTMNMSGNLSADALNGDIAFSGNITKNSGLDATATFKSTGSIILSSGVALSSTSNKLNTVLWADSDGDSDGGIQLLSTSSITTNGGGVWLGGGSGAITWTPWPGATTDITVSDGFAVGNDDEVSNGIFLNGTTITTDGGNIAMYGQGSLVGAPIGGDGNNLNGIHFSVSNNVSLSSGSGTIYLHGMANSSNINTQIGIQLDGSPTPHVITSSATSGDAITLYGEGGSANSNSNGLQFQTADIDATGGGNILLHGTEGTPGTNWGGMQLNNGHVNAGSGSLIMEADTITLGLTLAGSGPLIIRPATSDVAINIGTSGTSTGPLTIPAGYFSTVFSDGFSGITIGSTSAGLITVYGDLISYNDPLTLKTGNSIFFSTTSSVTGNGNALTLWSRAGGNNTADDNTPGAVWVPVGATVNSGGGDITIGGGADPTAGYALTDNGASSSENNARYRGVTINGNLNASGGDISIRGRGGIVGGTRGVSIGGSVSNTGSGNITINGIAKGTSDGVALGDGSVSGTTGAVSAVNGTVSIIGTKDTGSNGFNMAPYSGQTASIMVSGSGNLSIDTTGSINSGATTSTVSVGGTTTLSATGNIALPGTGNDFTGTVSVASGVNVNITDSNAMTLGGVTSSGLVDIATQSDNLTVTGAVSTTNTTAGALQLNAGKGESAGTSTGGDIVVSGGSFSVGSGGTALLYTGSIAGSTGVTGLSGYVSSYYNSDENSGLTPGVGLYVAYREADPSSPIATAPTVGDGSSGTPYEIATLENIYWIAADSTRWASHYIQTGNIDATDTSTWDSGAGWMPIGNSTTKFTGSYDGGGYTISNLYINRPGTSYVGLFGYIDASYKYFQNIVLDGGSITGGGPTGAIAGALYYGIMENCSSSATVNGTSNVGGLAGQLVSNASTNGIIRNCSSSGAVNGSGQAGGLVGLNQANGDAGIHQSFATGNVNIGTGNKAGGLVGYNGYGSIRNSYSTGTVTGGSEIGGFIGFTNGIASTAISNNYSTGQVVESGASKGGFLGSEDGTDKPTYADNFWDTATSGEATSQGSGATGKISAEMKLMSTFTNWDFPATWHIDESPTSPDNDGYPSLAWQGLTHYVVASGQTLFHDDFSGDGNLLGRSPLIGGSWSDTGGLETSGGELDTALTEFQAFSDFAQTLTGGTLTLTFTTVASTGPWDPNSGGWGGLSLYTSDTERLLLGLPGGYSYGWGIDIGGEQYFSTPQTNAAEQHEFTYDYDTGVWTYSVGGQNLSGTTTAGLGFDRLRLAQDSLTFVNIAYSEIKVITDSVATYTVTYNANGADSGTAPSAQTKNHDVDLNLATNSGNLAKAGYTFEGWNTASDGTGTDYAEGESYAANASITLYAKWIEPVFIATAPSLNTPTNNFAMQFPTGVIPAGSQVELEFTVTGNTSDDNRDHIYCGNQMLVGLGNAYPIYSASLPATVTYDVSSCVVGRDLSSEEVIVSTNAWNYPSRVNFMYGSLTFSDIRLRITLPSTYTVTYDGNGNTGGTAPSNQTKTHDVDLTLATNTGTLTKTGYTFSGWNTAADGTGTDYAEGETYTANASITLYAKWLFTHAITLNARTWAGGGTVDSEPVNNTTSPVTVTKTVNHNDTTTFSIIPSAGSTATATGCGGTLFGTTYTTEAITSDCEVTAVFTQNIYTVTATVSGGNGSVIPSTRKVIYNDTPTFTMQPDWGYMVDSVTGICAGGLSGDLYTTSNITDDCTLTVTFMPKSYTVSGIASANGGIAPSVNQSVDHGSTSVFTVTPDSGYVINKVLGCNGTLSIDPATGVGTFTTGPVTGPCKVMAFFKSE